MESCVSEPVPDLLAVEPAVLPVRERATPRDLTPLSSRKIMVWRLFSAVAHFRRWLEPYLRKFFLVGASQPKGSRAAPPPDTPPLQIAPTDSSVR